MKGTTPFRILLGVLIACLVLCFGGGAFVLFQSNQMNQKIRDDSVLFMSESLKEISSAWDLDKSAPYLNAEIPQGKSRDVWVKRFEAYRRDFGKVVTIDHPLTWRSRTEVGPEGDMLVSELKVPVTFERAKTLMLARIALRRGDRRRYESFEIVRQ